MDAGAAEHDVHGPTLAVHAAILAAAVVQAAEHDHGLADLELDVDNALGPVGAKVRALVAPQVRAGDHARGAVCARGRGAWDEEAEEDVAAAAVGGVEVRVGGGVAGVVVLVVAVEALGVGAGLDVHGDGDGEERRRDGGAGLAAVPARGAQRQKVFDQRLVQRVREEVFAYCGAAADEARARLGLAF